MEWRQKNLHSDDILQWEQNMGLKMKTEHSIRSRTRPCYRNETLGAAVLSSTQFLFQAIVEYVKPDWSLISALFCGYCCFYWLVGERISFSPNHFITSKIISGLLLDNGKTKLHCRSWLRRFFCPWTWKN